MSKYLHKGASFSPEAGGNRVTGRMSPQPRQEGYFRSGEKIRFDEPKRVRVVYMVPSKRLRTIISQFSF
jgi:hypothetical protein